MAHITGGEVTFERRLKTGDYEHKHAAVKMSFSVDESEERGSDPQSDFVARAHQGARNARSQGDTGIDRDC